MAKKNTYINKKGEEIKLLSKEALEKLSYSDFRKYASSVDVKCIGTRADITENILTLYPVETVKKESPKKEAPKKEPVKEAKTVKKEAPDKKPEKKAKSEEKTAKNEPQTAKKQKVDTSTENKEKSVKTPNSSGKGYFDKPLDEKTAKKELERKKTVKKKKPKARRRPMLRKKKQPLSPERLARIKARRTAEYNAKQMIIYDENIADTMVGIPAEDVRAENQRFTVSSAEKDERLYKELLMYQKYGDVLWGTLVSVKNVHFKGKSCVLATVAWNGMEIQIPDFNFIEPNYKFASTYESMTDAQKLRRRHTMISYMLGAKVCFVLDSVERTLIKDEYNPKNGRFEFTLVGNRRKAMAILRDIYFFHKNRKEDTKGEARSVQEGDLITARVIQVKEENILVECCGVESRIPAVSVSPTDVCTNCNELYSAGDQMKVRVKRVYINGDDDVHLSLTGQIVNPADVIANVSFGSTYIGTVLKVNRDKESYVVMLSNGVPCTVLFPYVTGMVPLIVSDKVRVTVTNVYREQGFVGGRATKL